MNNKIKTRKKRLKLGDIYEIALPNNKNAYGRLYKEYTLAIYNKLCNNVEEIPEEENYKFFCGVYKNLLQDGEWKIVGNREFENEEYAWPPPFCAINIIDNSCCIYYKEKFIKCDKKECHNLQVITFLNKEELINKLMLYI